MSELEHINSYAVSCSREKIPALITYMFYRAQCLKATLEIRPMSPSAYEKVEKEWYRRVATLMLLDMYSAMHPFDKEHVSLAQEYFWLDDIVQWWNRYKNLSAGELIDMIWVEVDL